MAILKQQPYNYSFSKNPMLWRFYTATPLAGGCFIQIKLQAYIINSTDDPLEFNTSIKPGTDGFANFYLEDIVDSMINFVYPGTGIINIAANIKKFKVSFREVTNVIPNPGYTDIATDYYVIKGGIENSKHDYNNYFSNYHLSNKPFATWLPDNCFAGLEDDFYLSILFANDFTALDTDARTLRIIAEWTDSSTDTIDINFDAPIGPYLLYHIKAGATALGINAIAAGRMLYRYKLQIVNTATPATTYSAVYTFYIDYRLFYKNKLFNFYNSVGGIDFVRVLGDTEETYNRTYTEAETLTGYVPVGSRINTQYLQTQVSRFNNFKSDIGYRHTIKETVYLQELLMSTMIWELLFAKNVRVWLQNKSNKLLQNSDTKFNFPIEWRYGFTEQVFTPAEVDFGDGVAFAGMTCPFATETDQTDLGGGLYHLSCEPDIAEAVGYVFEYKENSSSTWIAYATIVAYKDVAVTAGLTYNWRVKIKCDDSFYSAYTNGTDFTV